MTTDRLDGDKASAKGGPPAAETGEPGTGALSERAGGSVDSTTRLGGTRPRGLLSPRMPISEATAVQIVAASAWAYVLLLPLQVQLAPTFRLAPSDLALIPGVLALGVSALPWRKLLSIWHGLLVAALAASAAAALLTTGDVSQWALVNKTVGTLGLIAAYLVIGSHATSPDRVWRLVKALVVSVSVFNAAAIISLLAPIDVPLLNVDSFGRLSGGLVDPNAWGGLLTVALFAHLVLRRSSVPWMGRAPDTLVGGSLVLGLLLTTSRTAWIAAGTGLLALMTVRRRSVDPVLLGSVAAFVGLAALSVPGLTDWFVELGGREDTISQRMALNEAAFSAVLDHPLGLGLGVFQQRYGAIVHNTPLWFAADLGLPGLLVFVGIVASTGTQAVRSSRTRSEPVRSIALALGITHLTMVTLSLSIEAFYQRHWWVVMALLAAVTAFHSPARTEAAA